MITCKVCKCDSCVCDKGIIKETPYTIEMMDEVMKNLERHKTKKRMKKYFLWVCLLSFLAMSAITMLMPMIKAW